MKRFYPATPILMDDVEVSAARDKAIEEGVIGEDVTFDDFRALADDAVTNRPVYKNDVYQVVVNDVDVGEGWPPMAHLSIKRIDREPIHDWRDLQEIKNQIVGDECEAVELYPAESRLVDTANQYHLWCIKEAGARFPFGFSERFVTDEAVGKVKQRPGSDRSERNGGGDAG